MIKLLPLINEIRIQILVKNINQLEVGKYYLIDGIKCLLWNAGIPGKRFAEWTFKWKRNSRYHVVTYSEGELEYFMHLEKIEAL